MNESPGDLNRSIASSIDAALELDSAGRRRRGRRWLWWLGAALGIVAVLAWGAYALFGGSTAISWRTVKATRGDLVIEVNATGTLTPLTTVDVSSELSGVVRTVPVDENQRVKAGDVLAQLDTVALTALLQGAEAQVRSAVAQAASARLTLADAEAALARAESLVKRGMISTSEADRARSDRDRAAAAVAIAEAATAVAEANRDIKRVDLDKSTIRAPIDGVVLTRSVDPGQTVAASLSAPVLFVLAADLTKMELEAAIDEADVGAVAAGQTAHFTVDAWPGRQFTAVVGDVAYASTKTDNVVTYAATFAVDNGELLLRPGMTATVALTVREAKGIVTVPNEAFRFAPPAVEKSEGFSLLSLFMPRFPRGEARKPEANADGSRTLYVLADGQPQPVTVMPGASDGERTEIVSGLDEGAEVVTGMASAAR